jgi:hypothetical protein
MKTLYLSIITVTVAVLGITWVTAQDRDTSMSFFVTSAGPGNGAGHLLAKCVRSFQSAEVSASANGWLGLLLSRAIK